MKRRITVLVAILVSLPLLAQQEEGPATARGKQVNTTGKGYTAAIVIEPHSGQVMFEENATEPLPTASMAKMMTMLITMDHVRQGQISLDTPVTISAHASRMGGSQIYAKDGQVFPLRTLIAATMIQSANDAAEAIAEKIGGSEQGFVDMMNDKARQLGLKNSTFVDPHGLPNSKDPESVDKMSAHDLAILGMEVMKYPLLMELAKTPTMPFENATFTSGLYNPNHLINPHSRDYMADAIGIKTGYSDPAGYCVTAAAKRGAMELICVVMGADRSTGSQSSFGIASRLMNETFAKYRVLTGWHKGQVAGSVPVVKGRAKRVPAVPADDVTALVKRGEEDNYRMALIGSANAPVHEGQQVGFIVVKNGGKEVARVPALAAQDVAHQPWWRAFWPF